MTKEVMKQALDALNTPRPSDSYPPLWRTYENTINNAIKALEEALKQEQDEADDLTIAYMAGLYDGKKQAKQEQGEPVAGYYFPLTNEIMRGSIEALIAHAKRARWTDAIVRKDGVETKYEADWIKKIVPYTTPQNKEWVGLMRGVRVEGNSVIVTVNGNNDEARFLCKELIDEMTIYKEKNE